MEDTLHIHDKVKSTLYSLTGITLSENKDIMISNRLQKLKRDTNFDGDLDQLLDKISQGEHTTEFINSFTTNKTHFFREEFHFIDLREQIVRMEKKRKEENKTKKRKKDKKEQKSKKKRKT